MDTSPTVQKPSANDDEVVKKPVKLFGRQPPPPTTDEEHPEAVGGTVINVQPASANPFFPARPPPSHPEPHRGYVMASRGLSCAIGLLSIGSIVIAAVVLGRASNYQSVDEGDWLGIAVLYMFFSLVMAESCLCFVAALTCFILLLHRPSLVLIRNPSNGSFICLCVSVFILFLCTVYSIVIQVVFAEDSNSSLSPPAAVCIVHCVRAACLLAFFAVLVANSKLLPHDPRM